MSTATANTGIVSGSFADELDANFTRYAYLTIEERALPDARDGLKPSQRRLLVAMNDLNLRPTKKHIKCAKICGDTSGNYHPHGEQVVYPTLVRMAQSWVMRHPLAMPQGNFGNIDGDPPAAMRYTEARLSPFSTLLLDDLSADVVDFQPNYDEKREEPVILPAKIPNLLVNGVNGIAVGYATNMPPHNLVEVIEVVKAYIANTDIEVDEVMEIMPGPDFPNGGKILGRAGIRDYYTNGRGSVKLEGSWEIVENKGKQQIIIRELPYMTGPTEFLNQLVALVENDELTGIADARDLTSKKNGLCVQIDLKKGVSPELVLAVLQKKTCLRKTFSVNQTVIVDGKLNETMPLLSLIKIFVEFRELCLTRKFNAERNRNLARCEVIEGFIDVAKRLDEAIDIIRNSDDPTDAQNKLIEAKIIKTERQAEAVLSMTLRSLTKLEAKNLKEELEKLNERRGWLDSVIGNTDKTRALIVEELDQISKKHGNERRSEIGIDTTDISEEDLIKDEQVVVMLSGEGYVKRIPVSEYRVQARGGKGSRSTEKKDSEDGPVEIFEASTKDIMFFFTSKGVAYRRKAYEIPQAGKTSRGMHVSNMLNLAEGEEVTNMISMAEVGEGYLVMITRNGFIKRTAIKDYDTNRKTAGINAIKLEDGDAVAYVLPTSGKHDVFIVTEQGNAIRYSEEVVPVQGRVTRGSRSMKLNPGDRVAQIFTLDPKEKPDIFVITSAGRGKKSPSTEYRRLGSRNVKGYAVLKKDALAKSGGKVVGACALNQGDSLLALTSMGQAIRFESSDIRNTSRTTAGVRVVTLSDGDEVTKLAKLAASEDEE